MDFDKKIAEIEAHTLEERITALEQRVAALEGNTVSLGGGEGVVSFSGDVSFGERRFAYEWGRPTEFLTGADWAPHFERLQALAHPIRGEMLKRLLAEPATVAELVEDGIFTSTGTAYHHVQALQAAGWVAKEKGKLSIPPARVVPLLTIITATEEH